MSNDGLQFLLKFFNGGKIPRGLGTHAVTDAVDKKYKEGVNERITEINAAKDETVLNASELNNAFGDSYLLRRSFSIQQDAWSNKYAQAFLGVILTFMIIKNNSWKICILPLGCYPWAGRHTSELCLVAIKYILEIYGLDTTYIASTTQDTASNSFNTFDDVPVVSQLGCFGHKAQLFLKKGIESNKRLLDGLTAIHSLVVLLRGNNSPGRREALSKACKDSKIKDLRPILDIETRWGYKEKMIRRIIHLMPAIELLDVCSVFSDPAKRIEFTETLNIVKTVLPFMNKILPILSTVSQWTQIISSNTFPTLSLVRLACTCFKDEIEKIRDEHNKLMISPSPLDRSIGLDLSHLVGTLDESFEIHLNTDYTDFDIIMLAEFLDTRTYSLVNTAQKKRLIPILTSLCTKDEITSPHDKAMQQSTESQATKRGRRGSNTIAPVLTEEQQFELDLGGGSLSRQTPLQAELVLFFALMSIAAANGTDTLQFWADNQDKLPILSRIAARILSTFGSSTDVERMFSCSGRISTTERANLTGAHANVLTIMRFWYTHMTQTKAKAERASASTQNGDRFAVLHVATVNGKVTHNIVEGTINDEDEECEEDDVTTEDADIAGL